MKLVYHGDHDGKQAGWAVINHHGKESFKEGDLIELADYSTPLPIDKIGKDEKVYFVDYSFSESTADRLREIMKITDNIIWIDHHKSSIELIEKYPEFASIEGVRKVGISGSALTYMYLNKIDKLEDLPMFIRLIDDYDCWKKKMIPDSENFKLGLETHDFSPLGDIWRDLYNCHKLGSDYILDLTKEVGKDIRKWIDQDNSIQVKQCAFETRVRGLKCLAISKRTNSWMFDTISKDEYPLFMWFYFNGTKFIYTVVSNRDDIDASKICESYGGGGHKGIGGFQSKRILFTKKGECIWSRLKGFFKYKK